MSPPKLDWFEKSVIAVCFAAFIALLRLPEDHISIGLGALALIILLMSWKIGLSIK